MDHWDIFIYKNKGYLYCNGKYKTYLDSEKTQTDNFSEYLVSIYGTDYNYSFALDENNEVFENYLDTENKPPIYMNYVVVEEPDEFSI